MKNNIMLITGILIISNSYAQKNVCGKYYNHWNQRLELKTDSTFLYEYRFDLFYDKVIGRWKLKGDTMLLNEIPIYDTLYYKETYELVTGISIYATKMELIYSDDDKPEAFHDRPELHIHIPINYSFDINKLYIKQNKLYKIDTKGNIIKKGPKNIRKRRYPTYFFKEN